MSNHAKILYVGMTDNLRERVTQHRERRQEGFTKRYWLTKLVYYETHSDAYGAIQREKQLKKWHRQWKINLIKGVNPEWRDLSDELEE